MAIAAEKLAKMGIKKVASINPPKPNINDNQKLIILGLVGIALFYFGLTGKFGKLIQLAATSHNYTPYSHYHGGNGNENFGGNIA